QQHRHGVGLLPRRARRRPHPDGTVLGLACDQRRKDLLRQISPGGLIAEEPGDVDEDGVEEGGELVRVDLQVIPVVAVALDLELLQALADATSDAVALVTREVEAAALHDVLEQRLEVVVSRLGPSLGSGVRAHWPALASPATSGSLPTERTSARKTALCS